ncbi:MAG: spore coat protein [Bacillota bacterium]|nr:spore coat protein [Bacillota bacterium]
MPNLSDKDILHDLLATEKQVCSSYSVGITETSCNNLRNTLVNNFKSVQDIQYKIFDTMRQKGWYQIQDAPDNEVQQLKNKTNQMMNELK